MDPQQTLRDLGAWLGDHLVAVILGVVVLVIAARILKPALHRILVRIFRLQAADQGDDPSALAEANRRVETIEDLIDRALRFFYVLVVILVVFSVFDLWPLLA